MGELLLFHFSVTSSKLINENNISNNYYNNNYNCDYYYNYNYYYDNYHNFDPKFGS